MKFVIENPKVNISALLRRAGYHFQKREGEEMVFARRLTDQPFPRFHLFARIADGKFHVNLHIDHKRASHAGSRAHSGEYGGDSKLLQEETERLKLVAGS